MRGKEVGGTGLEPVAPSLWRCLSQGLVPAQWRRSAAQPCSGSVTDSIFSSRATASTSGSEVAIRSPCLAEAIRTASASEIGREER
jgi:hypothetical protein